MVAVELRRPAQEFIPLNPDSHYEEGSLREANRIRVLKTAVRTHQLLESHRNPSVEFHMSPAMYQRYSQVEKGYAQRFAFPPEGQERNSFIGKIAEHLIDIGNPAYKLDPRPNRGNVKGFNIRAGKFAPGSANAEDFRAAA